MRFLIDTNVISQPAKPVPNAAAMDWLSSMEEERLSISVITLAEFRQAIELLPSGRRKHALEVWLANGLAARFRGRILPVDEAVADAAGRLSAHAKRIGLNAEAADMFIAATAQVHGMALATLNRKHFKGLGVELVELDGATSQ